MNIKTTKRPHMPKMKRHLPGKIYELKLAKIRQNKKLQNCFEELSSGDIQLFGNRNLGIRTDILRV